jgi:hypothetical protein
MELVSHSKYYFTPSALNASLCEGTKLEIASISEQFCCVCSILFRPIYLVADPSVCAV